MVLSTHLIDEVANLLEHILVIEDGRIIIDSDADSLRGAAVTVAGRHAEVDAFVGSRAVLHRQNVGGFTSATINGPLDPDDRAAAMRVGLDLGPVTLQQLIMARTTASEHAFRQSAQRRERRIIMNRILKVVRLHLVNRYSVIGLPAMILGIAFTITLLFWILARTVGSDDTTNTVYSGAGYSVVIYLLVYAVLAISAMFPFALGFSVTRRDFYLGTALTLVLLSACYSFVLVVLSYLEEATNGWWLDGHIFGTLLFGANNPIERWLFYTLAMMFFSAIGMSIATIYMRWRVTGMLVFWAIAAVLVGGGIGLIGYTSSWAQVGQWFASNGSVGVAAWTLIPATLAASLGYLVLRRATP